jgi:hypothetical protein
MNMGGKNVFEMETVIQDVHNEVIDGTTDIDKGGFFGYGIIEEIAVGVDRPCFLMKDHELARFRTG